MYDGFLKKGGGATVVDAVRHLMHMIDIMGIEHVGIGTDFDGGGGVPGLSDATWLVSFTGRLISEGLTPYELTRIWGANFLSVWQRISAPD
jgi:microsomal dipeptidase-like Zn-dependent dipeptidase